MHNSQGPSCGTKGLVRDTRDLPYTYKCASTVIPAVTGHFCPSCGEAVLDASESARVNAAKHEFSLPPCIDNK